MVHYVSAPFQYAAQLWKTPLHQLPKTDGIEKNYSDAMENIVTLTGRVMTVCAAGTVLGIALSILKIGGTVGAVAAFTWKAALLTGTLSQATAMYIAHLKNQIDANKQ